MPTSEPNDRQKKALELRKAGLGYADIAERLGYANEKTARQAVQRMLERVAANDEEALWTLELERLDRLLVAIWPAALKNDQKAIDRALKIMERRSKLLGLESAGPRGGRTRSGLGGKGSKKKTRNQVPHDVDFIAAVLSFLAEAGLLPSTFAKALSSADE